MPTKASTHAHARTPAKQHGERLSSRQRGYTRRWEKASTIYWNQHRLCAECERQSQLTEATCVDHIIPHRGNQELFWDEGNWQSLCDACHQAKTLTEHGDKWAQDVASRPMGR